MPSDQLLSISWWQVISDEMIYHGDKWFLMRWYIMVTSDFWWDDISWWQVISDEMIYHGDKLFLMRWWYPMPALYGPIY
jgi:hypothetical protein